MRICAYVQEHYAKECYKNECLDKRQFVGLRVVMDALQRCGYEVEWAGKATVHLYDIVLVSITADCDWWSFIRERLSWQSGSYRVIIGGAGVLHVTPFLQMGDYFSLGRGEWSIPNLIRKLHGKEGEEDDSIISREDFSPDKIYHIRQADKFYPHGIPLGERRSFVEDAIGCNHKCLFCGYTWHRKFSRNVNHFALSDSLFGGMADKERAMLDMAQDFSRVDFRHLRTTAIDGMSERLRRRINKPITRRMVVDFLCAMLRDEGRPHEIKFYNIVGYPTETYEDWLEFVDTLEEADRQFPRRDRQWCILLHSTPFRAMPATPLACAPMSKVNYRRAICGYLGKGLPGKLIFKGNGIFSLESMGTESLSSVMLSAIAHRGEAGDTEAVMRLCRTPRFWSASAAQREATLERYFNMDRLFGSFTPEELPSRYLRTYCQVERTWPMRLWERSE